MPSTRSTMTAHDHRTLGPPIGGPATSSSNPPNVGLTTGLAIAATTAYLLPGLAAAVPALRAPLGVADRTLSASGSALTFDDGPHAQGTPAVLELLADAGVSATFFLVGEQVQR